MDLARLGFAFFHYAALLLLALIAYVIGRRILVRFSFNSIAEDIAFSIGLGLGVLAWIVMLLGFLHLIYWWVIAPILLGCLAICYPIYRSWLAGITASVRRIGKSWAALIFAVLAFMLVLAAFLPVFFIPLYPPTGYDATSYHLPLARQFVTHHGIEPSPHLRFPVFTMNVEMLFTLVLLFYDDVSTQLVSVLAFLVTVVALIGWGKRVQSLRAGIWAGALVLATPQIIAYATTAYIDIGLMMFVTLAVCSFMNWLYARDDKWLWLSAAFLGLACGTKYSALFLSIILALAVLIVGIQRRHIRCFLIFCLVVLVIGCPWYIRNFIYAGNPVFPFLSNLFGHTYWSQADLARQTAELAGYGTERNLVSLLLGPWNLVYHPEYFSEFEPITKAWFYILPVALIIGNMKSYTRWLLALAGLYYVFWFFTAQVIRYLDPILATFAVAAALSLDMLLERLPFWKPFWRGTLIAVLIAVALVTPGIVRNWTILSIRPPIPVTHEERLEFLGKGWGMPYRNIRLYEGLNRQHGADYTIYALDDREMVFYADGILLGDWFGSASYSRIMYPEGEIWKLRDSETVYRVLHDELGADYLLINTTPNLHIDLADIPSDEFFESHFIPIGVSSRNNEVFAVLFEIS